MNTEEKKINAANYNPDKRKKETKAWITLFNEIEEYIKTKTEDEKLIAQVKGICHSIEEEIVREAIVEKGMRPDGRALDEN